MPGGRLIHVSGPGFHRGSKRGPSRKVSKGVKRYVKSQINRSIETGTHHNARDLAQQNNTMSALDMSAIPRGDSTVERIGDKVNLKSLSLGIRVSSNGSVATNAVRIWVCLTREAGTPVIADFVQDVTAARVMISRRPLDSAELPKILYDRVINVTTDLTGDVRTEFRQVFLTKGFGMLEFDNAGATTSPRNKLWVCAIGMDNTNPPSLAIEGVVKFKDM